MIHHDTPPKVQEGFEFVLGIGHPISHTFTPKITTSERLVPHGRTRIAKGSEEDTPVERLAEGCFLGSPGTQGTKGTLEFRNFTLFPGVDKRPCPTKGEQTPTVA